MNGNPDLATRLPGGEVLRPVATEDADTLFGIADRWMATARWSLEGRSPSPAWLTARLFDDVLEQRVACHPSGALAGLLQVTEHDDRTERADLALVLAPDGDLAVRRALPVFLEMAFAGHDLRKLCVSALEDELDVPSHFTVPIGLAGRLVAHEPRGPGRYVDMLLYEVWRAHT